jgi:streptomycin 6-kinase
MPGAETNAAILALRQWNGRGIVHLLASDELRGVLLLERLNASRSLASAADDERATTVVAGLLRQLHSVPPPDGLPRLSTVVREMIIRGAELAPLLPDRGDRRRLKRWMTVAEDLVDDPGQSLLHWDLHFGNVLAADRQQWLAIDPEPLVGDPAFDLWPALDSGWSERPSDSGAAAIVRRRFDLLTDTLALDRQRAAGWSFARLMQNVIWDIEDGRKVISPATTLIDDVLTSI